MNAMKSITRVTVQILFFLLIAFTILMSFHACQKIEDPTRGVKLIVNYDLLKTNLNIRFFDAATGVQIGMQDEKQVKVVVTGESSSAVIDMEGESGKTYKSGGGYMTLFLNPNIEYRPSSENPIRFTLVASLDGYLEASKNMVITQEGDFFIDLAMVSSQLPPEGVLTVNEKELGEVVQGEVKEAVSVNSSGNEVMLYIPAGTIMKDENGDLLNGYLDVHMTYFNNRIDETLAAFPGGLQTTLQKDGSISDGVFYTAGFLSVEITDMNGKKAKTFENEPIALSLIVPEQTYNPQTASQVVAGDQVFVQSYDPLSGIWNHEKSASIEPRSDGLEVTAWLTRLSYWNFGWFEGNTCDMGVELLFTGDDSGCECVNVKGIMRKAEDDTFLRFVNMQACNGEPITITNAPSGLPVYIEWENAGCANYRVDQSANPLYIEDLCSNQQYHVPLQNESGETTTISIEVTARCSSYPDVEVHPSFGFYFREVDGNCWRYGYLYDGKADICDMEIGRNYIIGAYYENEWNEWEVTVTQSEYVVLNMELPDGVCNTLFD